MYNGINLIFQLKIVILFTKLVYLLVSQEISYYISLLVNPTLSFSVSQQYNLPIDLIEGMDSYR